MDSGIKGKIKTYYGGIAKKVSSTSKASCCCGASCCGDAGKETAIYAKEYLEGLTDDTVNASLGCANPLVLAELKEGDVVLDLGSGGGIDAFIASKYVGKQGKVFGLDMTDEMLELANKNKVNMGIDNVEFLKGYIEDIPLGDETVDVIISNCVINLCEDKAEALGEAYRVLKRGGRLAIADIVRLKDVPEEIIKSTEMWVGCIAGALKPDEYRQALREAGFTGIEIKPEIIYTKEFIKGIAEDKGLLGEYLSIDAEQVDGAFAGAYVKAYKE